MVMVSISHRNATSGGVRPGVKGRAMIALGEREGKDCGWI